MPDTKIIPIGKTEASAYDQMLSNYEPADLEMVVEQIGILAAGFPQGQKAEQSIAESIKAYAMVVERLPIEPIEIAVRNFLHGIVPDQNPRFMPTAPEFSKEARRVFFMWEYQQRQKQRKGN